MIQKFLHRNSMYFGLAGATLVLLCSLVVALFYNGPDGEPYSPLNHFISELGEVGVSPLEVMKWAVFVSTILWFAVIALAGRRTQQTGGSTR